MSDTIPTPVPPCYRDLVNGNPHDGWQKCYEHGVVPWDKGQIAPGLALAIQNESLPDGLAVVPGCGYGYDIAALASKNRKVLGVDIAPLAVERAQKNIANVENTEIRVASFFDLDLDGQVDLVYDYTFFCAIDLDMRPAWADKMASLLKSGGMLITLIFPLNMENQSPPPNPVTLNAYKDLLIPRGFELVKFDDTIPSFESRKGHEALGIWRRV